MLSRMGMMFERDRLVLKIHPEFNSLSTSNQEKLLTRNQLAAVALSVIQVRTFKRSNDSNVGMIVIFILQIFIHIFGGRPIWPT